MNNEEKQESKRLPGFYIALCCCVIAIGIAGYLTERNSNKTPTGESAITGEGAVLPVSDTIVQEPASQSAPANAEADDVVVEESDVFDENMNAEEDTDTQPNDENSPAAVIAAEPAFIVPATGEILEGYSDKLVYNSSLGDWRTHNGVDIAVDDGASVACIADGTITDISEDEMGMCVSVEHDAGFISKYRCLSSVEDITEGTQIKSGEVIGIVTSSKAETVTEPHIHFELYKDGEVVNPTDYIQY